MLNKIFNYHEKEVRTVFKDDQVWFVAKDVCEVLEISNSRDALSALEDDEKGVGITDTPGGLQEMLSVNESGLYHLIFRSRKKVAKEFRKWVTSEVLPTIRKHGFYKFTKFDEDELRFFIERFFPDQTYGEVSEKTGLHKLVSVAPHFRSCKIARLNANYHPDLFKRNNPPLPPSPRLWRTGDPLPGGEFAQGQTGGI